MSYFKTVTKFYEQDQKGNNVLKSLICLFKAISYTDAESQVYQHSESELGSQEFTVDTIVKTKFNDIFVSEEEKELWFKAKVNYIVFDEKSKKEKKMPFVFLLDADDVKEAHERLKTLLGVVQDYVIVDIVTTNIQDVILPEKES